VRPRARAHQPLDSVRARTQQELLGLPNWDRAPAHTRTPPSGFCARTQSTGAAGVAQLVLCAHAHAHTTLWILCTHPLNRSSALRCCSCAVKTQPCAAAAAPQGLHTPEGGLLGHRERPIGRYAHLAQHELRRRMSSTSSIRSVPHTGATARAGSHREAHSRQACAARAGCLRCADAQPCAYWRPGQAPAGTAQQPCLSM